MHRIKVEYLNFKISFEKERKIRDHFVRCRLQPNDEFERPLNTCLSMG